LIDSEARTEVNPLSERLQILRYVYGLNEGIFMNSAQLNKLWQLCLVPGDREEAMIFIASASATGPLNAASNSQAADQPIPPQQPNTQIPENLLSAAFSNEVCANAFLDLFCSTSISFQLLGEGAYRSFQHMFGKLRLSSIHGRVATTSALDTLWRICLGAGSDAVASEAMNDLLAVYIAYSADSACWAISRSSDGVQSDSPYESFGKRVFDCLNDVKQGLDDKDPSAELAAERCLCILNAAIGQGVAGGSIISSTLNRLTGLSPVDGLRQIVKYLPHGMRGQACYRKIGVMAKRTTQSALGDRDHSVEPLNQPRAPSTFRFQLDVHPLETLQSIKAKVAGHCQCQEALVKPISVSGRIVRNGNQAADSSQLSLNVVSEDSVVDELGIAQGCEMVFVLADHPMQSATNNNVPKARNINTRDLSDIFYNGGNAFPDRLFQTLIGVLEALPWREPNTMNDASSSSTDPHKLVWDLILAMPTNAAVSDDVLLTAQNRHVSNTTGDYAMEIDSPSSEQWSRLLDLEIFHRSVYVLLAIDAFLQPAAEALSCLPTEQRGVLERETAEDAIAFRRGFIDSGGFDGVVRFFSSPKEHLGMSQSMTRMGNAVALRILKCCLFGGRTIRSQIGNAPGGGLDEAGNRLLQSLPDAEGLLKSLTAMVVGDSGISTSTISDVLKFLRLLFISSSTAQSFVSLPNGMTENFLITLLLWEEVTDISRPVSSVGASIKVRKDTHDLILSTPILAEHALPWLIEAINLIQVTSDSTSEYFDVLQKLVAETSPATPYQVADLATAVCKKLSSCPRPSNEMAMVDFATGVLCGCLTLLRALIERGEGNIFEKGTAILVKDLGVTRWSDLITAPNLGMFSLASNSKAKPGPNDLALIDLMGVIFDAFLSPGGSSSVLAICCDKDSRQRGFDVVGAAARSCVGGDGYLALVTRINGLVLSASPFLKHRWGQFSGGGEGHTRSGRNSSKYSGLRNQGCTCYMNSVLQQLFMMPELRRSMCSATLPASVRASGAAKGIELVGKRIALQWDNGISYDAIVEGFDKETGMHTIRYCPMPVAIVGGANHHQVQAEDIERLPPLLPDEFFLSEGRPGKESGGFEIVDAKMTGKGALDQDSSNQKSKGGSKDVEETEDEAASRHLLEEFQRTLIHLEEGSRGRCFDPRGLVEASGCLKMEFDVWQQNDASEFSTKLLDRLETSLKRWAPDHFRYLDHTFGLKQTKQKICKTCGLKVRLWQIP
jgi:ubiquitin carboxyl-terminal hydrolase 9/24